MAGTKSGERLSVTAATYSMRAFFAGAPSFHSDSGPNCGVCPKCLRTLVLLDALGALDRYAKVLPVEKYRSQRPKALRWLYRQMLSGADPMLRPAYDVLKGEIPFRWKARARYWMFKNAVRKAIGIGK